MSASLGRPPRTTAIRQTNPSTQIQDRRGEGDARVAKGMSRVPPSGFDKYTNNKVGKMRPENRIPGRPNIPIPGAGKGKK